MHPSLASCEVFVKKNSHPTCIWIKIIELWFTIIGNRLILNHYICINIKIIGLVNISNVTCLKLISLWTLLNTPFPNNKSFLRFKTISVEKVMCRSIYSIIPTEIKNVAYSLVMDRITATAVNRMLVWQPQLQPRCGCEYHNRGYFFSTTAYILRNFYLKRSLFYLFWSSNCNYVIATYYFFL